MKCISNGSLDERINYAIMRLNLDRHDIAIAPLGSTIACPVQDLRYIRQLLLELKDTL